jgi:hypothetical protein
MINSTSLNEAHYNQSKAQGDSKPMHDLNGWMLKVHMKVRSRDRRESKTDIIKGHTLLHVAEEAC